MDVTLKQLLETVILTGATDLYVTTGASPTIRFRGEITKLRANPLSPHAVEQMVVQLLPDDMKMRFVCEKALDDSLNIEGSGPFRVNLLMQQNRISMTLHSLAGEIDPVTAVVSLKPSRGLKSLMFGEDDEPTHLMQPPARRVHAPVPADPWQTGLMNRKKAR